MFPRVSVRTMQLLVRVLPEGTPEVQVHPNGVSVATPSASDGDTRPQHQHKWIVRAYLLSAPVTMVVWLAGVSWVAVRIVGYVLS